MNHRASFNLLTKIHTNVSLTRFYPLSNCLLFAERIGDAYLGWIDLNPLHLCSVLPNNICSPLASSVPSFLTNLHLARSTHFKGARDKNTGVQMCPIAHHRIHRMTCWYLTGEMKRQLLPACGKSAVQREVHPKATQELFAQRLWNIGSLLV